MDHPHVFVVAFVVGCLAVGSRFIHCTFHPKGYSLGLALDLSLAVRGCVGGVHPVNWRQSAPLGSMWGCLVGVQTGMWQK